ncbi:MAG: YceI family protein [Flavobacteriales bacterium]|nr:YceI family protein [Flavobacteriales bacterium]MCB9364458.1 YceI family protein [Flavobacteriales bacterium]
MRKLLLSITVLAISCLTVNAHNHDEKKIDTKVSSVEWIGKKVTGQHEGTIAIKEGNLSFHDGNLEKGTIVIDMTSIIVTDLEGEWAEKLKKHLESPDFFNVEANNTATFVITKVVPGKEGKSTITGDLTIKGITHPITFESTNEMKDGKFAAFAELKVDRTLYDIKYGSGKFFEGLGDKMINDEFIIKFKIAAK